LSTSEELGVPVFLSDFDMICLQAAKALLPFGGVFCEGVSEVSVKGADGFAQYTDGVGFVWV
jgi:hypothetical protein